MKTVGLRKEKAPAPGDTMELDLASRPEGSAVILVSRS